MAFKILSFDELDLLTENQRKSYEQELAIYNERVKFVEQLERLENTVITPYEPKLTAIPAVCDILEKKFVEPEYELKKIAPFTKPELKVATIRFERPVMAVVPCHVKTEYVPAGHMKTVEPDKPVLPVISKAAAPASSFTKAEQQRPTLPVNGKINIPAATFRKSEQANPNLPMAVKPQSFEEIFFVPVTIDSSVIRANAPKLEIPVTEIPAFTVPEYGLAVLSKPEVEFPKAGVIELSELTAPVLPKVIISEEIDASWNQTGEITAKFPEIFHTPVVEVSFGKPNIQKTELPAVQKAEVPTKEVVISEYTTSDLPVAGIPEAGVTVFTAPEFQKPVVQTVMKPEVIPELLFAAPEFEKPAIQTVMKPEVSSGPLFTVPEFERPAVQTVARPVVVPEPDGCRMPVSHTPEIEYPSIDVFTVKPLKKVHSKASGLPVIHHVVFSDDCADDLLKIQLLLQKEYETGEGALYEKQ